jgi:hypothetical protein
MSDLTLLSLSFDDSFGSILDSIDGPLPFTDTERSCIRSAAFPESAVALSHCPHIYSFIVSTYCCHCVHLCRPATDHPRGCRLVSLVVASETGFLRPVFDLLKSIQSILTHSSDEVVALTHSLLKVWRVILTTPGNWWELPFFDGLRNYTAPLHALPGPASFARLNGHSDILRVWESAVFTEPIIVLGATPGIASKAVTALVSLLGPLACQPWLPYISLTDPRFESLMEKPIGIIGVSNPIIPSLMKGNVTVLKVGFACPRRHSLCARETREVERDFHLRQNSENLILAIRAAQDLRCKTPDLGIVKQKLVSRGVQTSSKMEAFVSKLVTMPLFDSLKSNYQCCTHPVPVL